MQFNSLRDKFKKIVFLNNLTGNQVSRPVTKSDNPVPDNFFSIPIILYDSDWIIPGVREDQEPLPIVPSHIEGNQDIYLTYDYYTTKKGQSTPFGLNYKFSQDLTISENNLPFIYPLILIDRKTNYENVGISKFKRYDYDEDYYQIKGDSKIIYQGYNPATIYFSNEEKINGDIASDCISKWYYGTLKYTIGADNYEITGNIVSIDTFYDVSESGDYPGEYNYKLFSTLTTDALTSSSVQGIGTYTVQTVTGTPPAPATITTTITKNTVKTVPIFEDRTILSLTGNLYKNGIYQGIYSIDNPWTVIFQGTLGGYATLTSFDFSWTTNQQWKLFYSNKRAKQVRFQTNETLDNFPETSDYETKTLPYAKLYVNKNPDDYPEIIEGDFFEYDNAVEKSIFTKKADNLFTFRVEGNFVLETNADRESSIEVEFIEESYSPDGDSYEWDGSDRPGKDKPLYYPNHLDIRFKVLIIYYPQIKSAKENYTFENIQSMNTFLNTVPNTNFNLTNNQLNENNLFKKNYELTHAIKNNIAKQKNEKVNQSNFLKTKKVQTTLKKLYDFSSDWEDLESNSTGNYYYKTWLFEFNQFDVRLLPYLDFKVLYKNLSGLDNQIISPEINKSYSIEDIEENGQVLEFYKKVYIAVNLWFYVYQLEDNIQVKLQSFFINPRQY